MAPRVGGLVVALAMVIAWGSAPLAQAVRISNLGHFVAPSDVIRAEPRARGGKRLYERFLDLLDVSGGLPSTATSFTIAPGVLAPGECYVFQVMLEDLENGVLENRSVTFSAPYTVLLP